MRQLDDWIAGYLRYTRNLEAPTTFHFWTAISILAATVNSKVWLDMGRWTWRPNFYIILFGPPGIVTKSTTIGIGESLLSEVPGVAWGPSSVTWQALLTAFSESTRTVETPQHKFQTSPIFITSSELGTFLNPDDREMIER